MALLETKNSKKLNLISIFISITLLLTACDDSERGVLTSDEIQSQSEYTLPSDTLEPSSDISIPEDTSVYVEPTYPTALDWTDPLYQNHYNFNESQKRTYNVMLEAFRRNISPIAIPEGVSEEEFENIYKLLQVSMYNYSHIPTQYTISVNTSTKEVVSAEIEYSTNTANTEKARQLVEEKIDNVLADFYDGMSDWAKIKYIHDFIALNCQYDSYAPNPDTAYGVLVEGRAMCEGYSKTFALMCNRAGIECLTVTGEADGGNGPEKHMWNMVRYNGEWYHIDVTWDDPASLDFLATNIDYSYFMVTTSQIRQDHTQINNNMFFDTPTATATDGNYYLKKGAYIWSYEDVEEVIVKQIIRACELGIDTVHIKAATPTLFNDIKNNVFSKTNTIYDLLNEAKIKADLDILTNTYSFYPPNESLMTFKIMVRREN